MHPIMAPLIGSQCYGIYYGVKLFKDLLDNRYFILKTDHKNLTYTRKVLTRLREEQVTANPEKTELGGICWPPDIEYRYVLH